MASFECLPAASSRPCVARFSSILARVSLDIQGAEDGLMGALVEGMCTSHAVLYCFRNSQYSSLDVVRPSNLTIQSSRLPMSLLMPFQLALLQM